MCKAGGVGVNPESGRMGELGINLNDKLTLLDMRSYDTGKIFGLQNCSTY